MEIFKYNRITFAQMYNDVVDYMTTKFQQADQIFSPASAYGQILTTILNLSQLIFYYIEDSITELNIYTAVRPRSIQGLARIAGHNPTRSIAASGALVVSYNGNSVQMYGNTVIIPNYTRLVNNATGIPYILNLTTEAARLNLTGKNSIDLNLVQGEIECYWLR